MCTVGIQACLLLLLLLCMYVLDLENVALGPIRRVGTLRLGVLPIRVGNITLKQNDAHFFLVSRLSPPNSLTQYVPLLYDTKCC